MFSFWIGPFLGDIPSFSGVLKGFSDKPFEKEHPEYIYWPQWNPQAKPSGHKTICRYLFVFQVELVLKPFWKLTY